MAAPKASMRRRNVSDTNLAALDNKDARAVDLFSDEPEEERTSRAGKAAAHKHLAQGPHLEKRTQEALSPLPRGSGTRDHGAKEHKARAALTGERCSRATGTLSPGRRSSPRDGGAGDEIVGSEMPRLKAPEPQGDGKPRQSSLTAPNATRGRRMSAEGGGSIRRFNGAQEDSKDAEPVPWQGFGDEANLHGQLSMATKVISQLNLKVASLQQKLNSLQAEYDSAQKDLREKEDEVEELNNQIMAGADTIKNAEKQTQLATKQLALSMAVQSKDSESLHKENAKLREDLERVQSHAETKEKGLLAQIKRLKEFEEEVQMAYFKKRVTKDRANQTEEKTSWRRWTWLLTLSLHSDTFMKHTHSEVQTDIIVIDGVVQKLCNDSSTQTVAAASGSEAGSNGSKGYPNFWPEVLKKAEVQMKFLKMKKDLQMGKTTLLGFISNIYAGKLVGDELDDRNHMERISLGDFIHAHYILTYRDKRKAEEALILLYANVMFYLKSEDSEKFQKFKQVQRVVKKDTDGHHEDDDGDLDIGELHVEAPVFFLRLYLFARFLGLSVKDQEPLPQEALNIYLGLINRIREGETPLLRPSNEIMKVEVDQVLKAIEFVFHNTREHQRKRLLTDIQDSANHIHQVDMDHVLGYLMRAWEELSQRSSVRLESIYQAFDSANKGQLELESFLEMMSRLEGEGKHSAPLCLQLRMFRSLSQFPQVLSSVFLSVMRAYHIAELRMGSNEYGALMHQQESSHRIFKSFPLCPLSFPSFFESFPVEKRVYAECFRVFLYQESQFAKLATLYNASARQIEVYLDDVDPVLEVPEKWRIINKLIHEKHEPELALLCLNIVTKTFSTAMKANKHTFAAAEALEDAFKKASGSKASAADEATQRRKAMVQALKVHSPTVPAAGSKPQPRMNSPGRHSQDRHSSPTAEKDGSHSPGSRSPLPRSKSPQPVREGGFVRSGPPSTQKLQSDLQGEKSP